MHFLLAVKRLMKEAAELKDPTDHYHAQPLEVGFCLCPEDCRTSVSIALSADVFRGSH